MVCVIALWKIGGAKGSRTPDLYTARFAESFVLKQKYLQIRQIIRLIYKDKFVWVTKIFGEIDA